MQIFSTYSIPLSQLWFVSGIIILALVVLFYFLVRPRCPNAPILRVSQKPGILGVMDDWRLLISDITQLVNAGWERYSKHGINYLLDTPTDKLLIVAPQFLEEVRKAPDDHASTVAANALLFQLRYTIHKDLVADQYHIENPVRKSLTQSIERKIPEIVEQAKISLEKLIDLKQVSCKVASSELAFDVVTQISNRILFGIELARNPEFHTFSRGYAQIVFHAANLLHNFPDFCKPLVLWWKTDIYSTLASAKRFVMPLLQQRIAEEDYFLSRNQRDEWEKVKADDMVQWVLDETPLQKRDPEILTYRMLHINIASLHTTSTTFLDILLCIAVQPQYHNELREEIVDVFRREGGWSKHALTQLIKMDSFMSEVHRLCGITSLKMGRIALRDWQLSDGTRVPKGTFFFMNHQALVLDPQYFDRPAKFDPWRMYRLRQHPEQADLHQFVTTSEKNLAFGHGRHACPGRHFAANEIKICLVLILTRYDIIGCGLSGGHALTLQQAIRGSWFNKMRRPVMHAELRLLDRRHEIPVDLQATFS